MSNPPNPWGSCFDSTAHVFLREMWRPAIRVCHGIGIANRPGQEGLKIAHAWLEFDQDGTTVALDCIWMVAHKASRYREGLQLSYAVSYGKHEFLRRWIKYDFPGPWDAMIKEFTSESLSQLSK